MKRQWVVAMVIVVICGARAQAGLVEGVWETTGAQGGAGVVPGVADQPAPNYPTDAYVTQLQTELASVSPTYTYLNNAVTFNYNGGDGQSVSTYLGADGPGAGTNTGTTDTTQNFNTVYDANGYLKVGASGNYTFALSYADDAARIYVGGNHQVGDTSFLVAQQNYGGNIGGASSGVVSLTAGVYYPFEVFTYQGYGGANLQLVITGPDGNVDPNTVTFASVPEPTSLFLWSCGALGLLWGACRRRSR